jgi:hypothetical protein
MDTTIETDSTTGGWYRGWLLLLLAAFVAIAVTAAVAVRAGDDRTIVPEARVQHRITASADSLAQRATANQADYRVVGSADAFAQRSDDGEHEPVYGSADSLAARSESDG